MGEMYSCRYGASPLGHVWLCAYCAQRVGDLASFFTRANLSHVSSAVGAREVTDAWEPTKAKPRPIPPPRLRDPRNSRVPAARHTFRNDSTDDIKSSFIT